MNQMLRTIAVFIALVGALLLIAPLPGQPRSDHSDRAVDVPTPPAATAAIDPAPGAMLESLASLHEAQRALDDENYRDAREHLAAARESISAYLEDSLGRPSDGPSAQLTPE